jgi:hypothetical protein
MPINDVLAPDPTTPNRKGVPQKVILGENLVIPAIAYITSRMFFRN